LSLVNKDTNKLQLNVYKLKIGFRIDKARTQEHLFITTTTPFAYLLKPRLTT